MSQPFTLEQFHADVARYVMTVQHDDGLYRHLRFGEPGTFHQQFDLITWPGYLAYVGDVGSYVFARLPDMFRFFRGHFGGSLLYWAEKCEAVCKTDGLKIFSPAVFEEAVAGDLDGHVSESRLQAARVIAGAISDRAEVETALAEIEECTGIDLRDGDFWEHDLTDYAGRFRRCCFAIPWAIGVYDRATAPADLPEGDGRAEDYEEQRRPRGC